MKKNVIRISSLFGILAIFLCSCGKEQDALRNLPVEDETGLIGSQTESVGKTVLMHYSLPEGYVLSTRFEYAGDETASKDTYLIEDTLYYHTTIYDPKQEAHIQSAYIQEKGKDAQLLLTLTSRNKIGKYLTAMAAGQDESLYFLYEETDEDFKIYTLEKRDKELQVIYSVDAMEGMQDIPGIYDMEVGADGTLYGLTTNGTVLCWDESGTYQSRFTLPENAAAATANGGTMNDLQTCCYGLVNAGDLGVYAYWGGKDSQSNNILYLYDLKKWEKMDEPTREKAVPLQLDFKSAEAALAGAGTMLYVFSGYEDGLYMADQIRLWWINLTDGSLETLLSWSDLNLKPGYVEEVRRQEDGGYLIYAFDTLEQRNYWVTLEPVPASELPEKHELVLGVAGSLAYSESLTSRIDQVVLSYNRTHPFTHVTVKEYGNNNITNFQLELLTGKGPDILMEMESFLIWKN